MTIPLPTGRTMTPRSLQDLQIVPVVLPRIGVCCALPSTRPILMTALATIVGILPIAAGIGAGGESRAPLGVAVVGGMLFSTLLTFYVVPATYITLERLRDRFTGPVEERREAERSAEGGAREPAAVGS